MLSSVRRQTLVWSSFAVLSIATAIPVEAQTEKVDERRVEEILHHAETRASSESNASFDYGDFPRAVQLQKFRYELRPWDGGLATDLIWMLGNVGDDGTALSYAIRYRRESVDDPDHSLPLAQLYWNWRMFSRIPELLEDDIKKDWPMHRNVFVILSNAYARMGYHKDVVRVLDVALKHFPGDEVFIRNRERSLARIDGRA